jgi:hypothetical protein
MPEMPPIRTNPSTLIDNRLSGMMRMPKETIEIKKVQFEVPAIQKAPTISVQPPSLSQPLAPQAASNKSYQSPLPQFIGPKTNLPGQTTQPQQAVQPPEKLTPEGVPTPPPKPKYGGTDPYREQV